MAMKNAQSGHTEDATSPNSDQHPDQRAETDDSLRTERGQTDERERVRAADDADRIIDVARSRADAVLSEARDLADEKPRGASCTADIARERADADEILQDERALADERLGREREDFARVLSALLPLSRKSTDLKLLTERASADAALEYRDDFLGMVSHDLNNLLGAILVSADILARGVSETPEGKRIAIGTRRIQLYSVHMKRLIGDLTDVTSLAAGKLKITLAESRVGDIVEEAVATFRMLSSEKSLRLELVPIDPRLSVRCDRGRLIQVLANVLGNAIKFTPVGGTVTVNAIQSGDEVSFSVSDTGPGIPAHLVEAVFERFWQAEGAHDRRGLGLGLYIARGIVEAHGGRIWVKSQAGEGSTFLFTVPCIPRH